MPKFDASSVSAIEYDLTGFTGCRGSVYAGQSIPDQGVVPEPSRDMVSAAMARVSKAFEAMDMGGVSETPEAIAEAMQKVDSEGVFAKLGNELIDTLVELCDGHPRRESLESLGWRSFMSFFGYIMGELMSPEKDNSASSATPARLRSV
jgi:hypothetical protein